MEMASSISELHGYALDLQILVSVETRRNIALLAWIRAQTSIVLRGFREWLNFFTCVLQRLS